MHTHAMRLFAAFAAFLCLSTPAISQTDPYPGKTIRFVVPYAAGGGVDMLARTFANSLATQLNTPVVVENKPGANGVLGTREVAQSPGDGYSFIVGVPATIAINPNLYAMGFDTAKDLQPVAEFARANFVLVTAADSGIQSLPDLIAKAKAAPGKLSYASHGNGSAAHLGAEMLNQAAGIQTTNVPYKGSAAAMPDLLAGRVSFGMDVVVNIQQHVTQGKLKVLAVLGDQPMPQFPGVPIARSTVPGLSLEGWVGLFAPSGVPPAIVNRVHNGIASALQSADVRNRLAAAGFAFQGSTLEQFREVVRKDIEMYSRAARKAGLRVE